MEKEKSRFSGLRELTDIIRTRHFDLKTTITIFRLHNLIKKSEKEAHRSGLKLQQEKLPESLEYWTKEKYKQTPLSSNDATRQIFDLTFLPDKQWVLFRKIQYHCDPYLSNLINESEAIRTLNSKDEVINYFKEELIENHDPYLLINDRIDMPGHGIERLFNRLLDFTSIENLTPQEKTRVNQTLGFWEEAALEVICDPDLYFTKTAIGNEGTISEFLGSMITHKVKISNSPNFKSGKYRDTLFAALDYEGITEGKYKIDDHNSYSRQRTLLRLFYKSQGENNRLGREFWRPIGKNEDFTPILHWIAVNEGYPDSDQLLLSSLDFAWKRSQDGNLMYDLVANNYLHTHFDGKTAAGKFLADPSMKFEEKFGGSRFQVQEHYLKDFQQLNKEKKDFIVLLDCIDNNDQTFVRYAHIGQEYSEHTFTIDNSMNLSELDNEIISRVFKMVDEFKTFKENYLLKLQQN